MDDDASICIIYPRVPCQMLDEFHAVPHTGQMLHPYSGLWRSIHAVVPYVLHKRGLVRREPLPVPGTILRGGVSRLHEDVRTRVTIVPGRRITRIVIRIPSGFRESRDIAAVAPRLVRILIVQIRYGGVARVTSCFTVALIARTVCERNE